MRITLLLILVLLLIHFKLFAQFQYGVRMGVNLSNVKGLNSSAETTSTLVSPNVGFFGQYSFSKKFFLNTGLQYNGKGYNTQYITSGSNTISTDYISIPALIGFNASQTIEFMFGPEIGYLVKAKSKAGSTQMDITSNFQKIDFGLDLATKINFSKRVGMEFSYSYGLTKVETYSVYVNGIQYFSSVLGNNRAFQIDLFYKFKK